MFSAAVNTKPGLMRGHWHRWLPGRRGSRQPERQ